MINIPDFHRLNKSRTTEMNSAELNAKLREEAARSAKNAKRKKAAQEYSRKQQKISEQTKKQLPPQSPARKRREQELKRQAELELKEKKHRRKRGSNVVYYVAVTIILVAVFAVLSVTVLFNIESIIVVGDSIYTDEQIIAASGLQGNENLVRLNLSGTAEKILDKLVELDSVRVDKTYPSAVTITVERSVPMANFYFGGRNYVISHTGRVMRIGDEDENCMRVIGYEPADSVIVGGFVKAKDEEQDRLIKEISEAIEKGGLTESITTVNIADPIGIKMSYEDRVEIYLGSILRIDQKVKIINELLGNGYIAETERVTLDVSDTSRATVRPITTSGAATAPPETEESIETDENGDPIDSAESSETTGQVTDR